MVFSIRVLKDRSTAALGRERTACLIRWPS